MFRWGQLLNTEVKKANVESCVQRFKSFCDEFSKGQKCFIPFGKFKTFKRVEKGSKIKELKLNFFII